jgi:hypothetical protein
LSELAVPWCYYFGAITNDELVKAMEFAFWIGPLLSFGVLFVKVWSRFWLLSLDDHNDLMTDVHEYAMLRVKNRSGVFVLFLVDCFTFQRQYYQLTFLTMALGLRVSFSNHPVCIPRYECRVQRHNDMQFPLMTACRYHNIRT